MTTSTISALHTSSEKPFLLLAATAVGALVVLSPLFWNPGAWFIVFGVLVVVPHARVLLRVARRAGDRSGYSLGIGVSAPMMFAGALLFCVEFDRSHPNVLSLLFSCGLLASHALLMFLAIPRYRRGSSVKPHWRLLLGAFVGCAAYYFVLFVLASGAAVLSHHRT